MEILLIRHNCPQTDPQTDPQTYIYALGNQCSFDVDPSIGFTNRNNCVDQKPNSQPHISNNTTANHQVY